MINYKEIGTRIRTARVRRSLSQEQLAEAIGVGSAHISHIETGNSTPSVQTLIDIINALDCSADELLCLEIQNAQPAFDRWFSDFFSDCTIDERKVITDTMVALKNSLRRMKKEER